MQNEAVPPAFPMIDLGDLLIPWEKCFGVNPGPLDPKVIATMEEENYDFSPVFERLKSGNGVLGLISRARLKEITLSGTDLKPDDYRICRPEIYDRPSIGTLLDTMASNLAVMVVVDYGEHGPAPIGLLTRSDLNKHPFRAVIYSLLAGLETALARLVKDWFQDHWVWVSRLSEEKQARILGYWELSKRRGVDLGPVAATTLAELLTVVASTNELRTMLGYKSRNSFEGDVGRIPDLRNQIMHPVRPLITDGESIVKLKEDTTTILLFMERLKERKD